MEHDLPLDDMIDGIANELWYLEQRYQCHEIIPEEIMEKMKTLGDELTRLTKIRDEKRLK